MDTFPKLSGLQLKVLEKMQQSFSDESGPKRASGVLVTDSETGEEHIFPMVSLAAEFLESCKLELYRSSNTGSKIKKRYYATIVPVNQPFKPRSPIRSNLNDNN